MTWHPDIPMEYRNQIVIGDARVLAEQIPDESVDLIFTDPVYDRIDDYQWLAETAARVLKPDRACLVWCGIGFLPYALKAMSSALSYRWQFAVVHLDGPTSKSRRFFYRGFNKWHTCLWYEKGDGIPQKHIVDCVVSGKDRSSDHKWRKGLGSFRHWLARFVQPGSTVFDPFAGDSPVSVVCKMLGRNYIAFEIDPDTAERARERVRNTQPPLFVPEPEQMEMAL